MGRFTRVARICSATVLLLSALAIPASASWAAKPTSRAEALAQGNPAATAPSFDEDADGAVFQGRAVDGPTILANELSCLAVDVGPDRCYKDALTLQQAELGSPATARRPARPKVRAAACGIYEILIIWTGADYQGASAAFAERRRWANLRAEVNDEGSSFVMGDHSGHLAEYQDGYGYWYPGNTGVCAHENNLNLNGSGWNNRISSRYRN